jgi:hypothetical protein
MAGCADGSCDVVRIDELAMDALGIDAFHEDVTLATGLRDGFPADA